MDCNSLNMITTSLSSTAAWVQIQAALAERGLSTILLTILSIVVMIIAADYAHIIYLHLKMVRLNVNPIFA